MKHKRKKDARKSLEFYKINFGLTLPYRVVADTSFLVAAQKYGFAVEDGVAKAFSAPCIPSVTRCTVAKLKSLGEAAGGAAGGETMQALAAGLKIWPCGHATTGRDGGESQEVGAQAKAQNAGLRGEDEIDCLKSITERAVNADRSSGPHPFSDGKFRPLILATTNPRLLRWVKRKRPGLPVVTFCANRFTLERPSELTMRLFAEREAAKLGAESAAPAGDGASVRPRRRGALGIGFRRKKKQPHPLSCLPSKKEREKRRLRKLKAKGLAPSREPGRQSAEA